MKKGWETKRLGEVCEIVNGGTPKTSVAEYWDGKHRWITPAEMGRRESPFADDTARKLTDAGLRNSSASLVPPFSVILSSRAPIGHLVVNTQPMSTNQGCKSLIPCKQLDYKFLYFYLGSIVELLESLGTGATFKELSGGKLKEVGIPVPPLPEQRRIVGLLDEAFAAIATAKANAEKNLQNAREIFESHLNEVFAKKGEGWVEKTIGETCMLRSGTTVSLTLEKPIGDVPYLKVADMNFDGNEDQITTSSRFLDNAAVREVAIIPKGATIFPKRGGAILTNKKRITSLPICADLNIMAVIPSSQINAWVLYYYFLNVDMRKLGTGSSIPQINNYDVAPLLISFPKSLITQEQIVEKLDALSVETRRLAAIYSRKLAALEELKQALLHRAFSGEL